MQKLIHSTADEEHAALRIKGERTFSVRISLSVELKLGEQPDVVGPAYKTFLDDLKTWSKVGAPWAVFVMKDAVAPPERLPDGAFYVISAPLNAKLLESFADWLQAHIAKLPSQGAGSPGKQEEVSETELTGFHTLMGAAGWLAPIPQALGLTHILVVPGLEAAHNLAIVPLIGAIVPDDAQPAADTLLEVALPPDSPYVCRASVSQPVENTESLLDDHTGFIRPTNDSGEQGLALRRIEQCAGSLFTTHSAAGEIRWPEQLKHQQDADAKHREDEWRFFLGCLAWQAAGLLGSAFDTLLLALVMPGRSQRDGQLLAPFLDILVGEGAGQKGASASERRRTLRAAIRRGIRQAVAQLHDGLRSASAEGEDEEKFREAADPLWTLAGLSFAETELALPLIRYAVGSRNGDNNAYEVLSKKILDVVKKAGEEDSREYLTRRVAAEMGALNESLLSESGIERALVAWLELRAVRNALDLPAGVYDSTLATLRNQLANGLNGAEAARQSVGSLVADRAMTHLHPGEADWRKRIQHDRRIWEFWCKRLRVGAWSMDAPEAEAALIQLPREFRELFEGMSDPAVTRLAIRKARRARLEAARDMALDARQSLLPNTQRRFIPDAAPAPLLIRIPVDPAIDDDNGVDEITAGFAGFALLTRRGGGPWAHACLAKTEPQANPPAFSIAPLPSAVVDNRRELFLSHDGHPPASNAYEDVIDQQDANPGERAFMERNYPSAKDLGAFAQQSFLADGTKMDVVVAVVGRSGLLPERVRDSTQPWLPRADPKLEPHDVAASFQVSRCTAIGQAELSVSTGRLPEGLLPLSADYPRLAVEEGLKTETLRNNDGTGGLTLPRDDGEGRTLTLRDIEPWHDDAVALMVGLGVATPGNADPKVEFTIAAARGDVQITVNRIATNNMQVTLTRLNPPIVLGSAAFDPEGSAGAWLRLMVDKGSISLADPSLENREATPGLEGGEAASTARSAPENRVLLGAPWNGWLPAFQAKPEATLSLPRMTFQEFMRWANNELLADAAIGIDANTTAPDAKKRRKALENFRICLVALDMGRLDEPEDAKWLDRLPDLAVHQVQLAASPLDGLVAQPGRMGVDDPRARAVSRRVEMPSLWTLIQSAVLTPNGDLSPREEIPIVKLLQKIDKELTWKITLTPTDTSLTGPKLAFKPLAGKTKELELMVPGGLTVRLSTHILVKPTLFTDDEAPTLDPRLRSLAVRDDSTAVTFGGSHLLIETMPGPLVQKGNEGWQRTQQDWARDREALLQHKPAGLAPRYDLILAPDMAANWTWRQIGQVTTQTQAWRFDGKPIYNWIDPHWYADAETKAPKAATYRMLPEKIDDPFRAFERELFDDRSDDDAQPRTVRMLPLGRTTLLVTVQPEALRGATLYRHALELRSRYAAAMVAHARDGTCAAWSESDGQPGDVARWMRVAILAARPTGALTRPQLRALLPLTRRPSDEGDGADVAPPVLAMLQEEPLAFGGLAARIVTEIRTGVGHGGAFDDASNQKVIVARDFRKEVGPDPRLSFRALHEDAARRAVLTPEGPIGLTFDRDAQAGAGFANTALILHPELLDAAPGATMPEELFLSVGMQRCLDPAWLIPETGTIGAGPLPLDRGALWIEVQGDVKLRFVSQGIDPIDALALANATFKVDRRAIEKSKLQFNPLHLCDVPRDHRPILLVQPQDKGRLSVSILLSRGFEGAAPEQGPGTAPFILASVELTLPEGHHVTLEHGQAQLTAASATTALHWVRTNADFARVTTAENGSVEVDRLVARLIGQNLTFAERSASQADGQVRWIRPQQALRQTPTHVQRHAVLLASETWRGVGRDIERPRGAWLAPAAESQLMAGIDTVRVIEIETPAELMGWHPNAGVLPARYCHAVFDLAAIGFNLRAEQQTRLLFRLRHVAASKALPAGTSVQVGLSISPRDAMPNIELRCDGAEALEFFVEIVVTFPAGGEGELKIKKPWAITKAGQMLEVSSTPPPAQTIGRLDTVILSVKSITWPTGAAPDSEAWFETSMLAGPHSEQNPTWRFDFDWIFGAEAPRLADVFQGESLAARPEAQARIVKISPPIPII